jgi:alpha-mannosidase
VDPATGTIRSLVDAHSGRDLVAAGGGGLDALVYVSSRDPAERHGASGVSVERVAWGPAVHTIRVTGTAPGTSGFATEVSVVPATGRVEIVNRVDKELVYTPEALLWRFPFALDAPRVRVSVPTGWYEAEREQLPGANRNYLTVERWVDLSDSVGGVTVASVDAPLIQLGEIRTDAIVAGWADTLPASGTLFSYAMNNYWETNYRAGQDGPHELHYALRLHDGFDAAAADRWGREVAQPLVVSAVSDGTPAPAMPFTVSADRAVVTAVEAEPEFGTLLVRVYNPAEALNTVTVTGYEPFALMPCAITTFRVEAARGGGR